jgi:CubicO group peptidase (beta-lactamase class C family)
MLLNKGTYKGKKYLKAETIELFSSQAYPSSENRRGLGFDKPNLDSDSSSYPSEICSPESYGHSGFTGTFVWINPTHNSFMIFLSNRVFPTRAQKAIYSLGIRGKILDVLLEN